MIKNPKVAAITGAVLCLPAVVTFLFSVFGIEPYLGPITEGRNIPGSIFAVLFFTVFPLVSFLLNNFGPERSRVNRGIASFSLGIVVAAVIAFVVDQYPCWRGEANCD